jgi:hypothetical protein
MSSGMARDDRESTIGLAEAIVALTVVGEDGRVDVDLGLDPTCAETIGDRLATLLAEHNASLVLSWAGENDTVLAHMVARRLGVPRASIELDLGLLTVGQPVNEGTRAVLVGVESSASRSAQVVATLLAGHGSELVAVGYIKRSRADAGTGDGSAPILVLEK